MEKTFHIALSEEDIEKLFRFDLSCNPKQGAVRDLFIFGCHTGLRLSDYSNIKRHHIIEMPGVRYRIRKITQKTTEPVEIPCTSQVIEIFERYKQNDNWLPKKITDQKFNKHLKEICKMAGFTRLGCDLSNPDIPMYELIKSHTARRSFITNFPRANASLGDIMKMSGQKTERVVMGYIKTSNTEAADRIEELYKKREAHLKTPKPDSANYPVKR